MSNLSAGHILSGDVLAGREVIMHTLSLREDVYDKLAGTISLLLSDGEYVIQRTLLVTNEVEIEVSDWRLSERYRQYPDPSACGRLMAEAVFSDAYLPESSSTTL